MGISEIDQIIAYAKERGVSLQEIVISGSDFKALAEELFQKGILSIPALTFSIFYGTVMVTRRKCTGCCSHGE